MWAFRWVTVLLLFLGGLPQPASAGEPQCAVVVAQPGVIQFPAGSDRSRIVVSPRNIHSFVLFVIVRGSEGDVIDPRATVEPPNDLPEAHFQSVGEADAESPRAIRMSVGGFIARNRSFTLTFAGKSKRSAAPCTPAIVDVVVDIDYEKSIFAAQTAQRANNELVNNAEASGTSFDFFDEFPLLHVARMLELKRSDAYFIHVPGDVPNMSSATTADMGLGTSRFLNRTSLHDVRTELRIGLIKVSDPRIYFGVGYETRSLKGASPLLFHSLGYGIEKLPDAEKTLSWRASFWNYPTLRGWYTYPSGFGSLTGRTVQVEYSELNYAGGVTAAVGHRGLYVEAGYTGTVGSPQLGPAPAAYRYQGIYTGIGLFFFGPY